MENKLEILLKKLETNLDSILLLNNIAVEYYNICEYNKSLEYYNKAYDIDDNDKMKELLSTNIGLVCYAIGDYVNAIKYFSNFDTFESGWHKSLCYLNLLDLKNGFIHYQNRYKRKSGINDAVYFPYLPLPFVGLDKTELKGKILVLNEQGFGDSLMFSKSFNDYKYENLTVQCYPELLELFRNLYPKITFFTERSFGMDFVKQFDCYTSDGNLFAISNMNGFKNINLDIDNKEIKNIGICLSSNKSSKIADKKSINLSDLNLNLNYNLYNLGIDKVDGLISLDIKDFNDTYEHIKNMDLVISVDTAIVHLSGLVNKKTILVIKDYLDWRWKYVDIHNRSLIYPSVEVKNVSNFKI